jgi:uncharacterized protein (TIGR03067 family)
MPRLLCLSLAFLGVGLVAAADEDAKKEYERFTGTWKFASIEVDGKKVPEEALKGALILKGDKWTLKHGDETGSGTYKVDLSKKPKTIDIEIMEGPQKGETMKGIYKLEGDTYTVCLAFKGKDRPTDFASKPGSGHVLEVLKREK